MSHRLIPEADSEEEFELVVGRRQIAGIAFLALVMVAVCSGASYLAGKAISAREEAAEPVIKIWSHPRRPLPLRQLHRCSSAPSRSDA